MNDPRLHLLVLAAIAVFMFLRLKNVLGTRDGFEPKIDASAQPTPKKKSSFEVIEGGLDPDITDHVEMDSDAGQAFVKMKASESDFTLEEFQNGARQAYEMILMAFEGDDLETLEQFLAADVYEGFASAITSRQEAGYKVNANFIGIREMKIMDGVFDTSTNEGEITMKFVAELVSFVEDDKGKVVEGNRDVIKRQTDVWTFAKTFGNDDPNWELVATGE